MDNITNYERIKNMSVEEMARFLYNDIHEDDGGAMFIEDEFMFELDRVVNWLNSEVDNG